MNFKGEIKWKSHKRGGKWNLKCDTGDGGVCVWIKTGLDSAGLVPTDCLKRRNRFKAGSRCWQVELCTAIFPIPFSVCQELFTCNQQCSNTLQSVSDLGWTQMMRRLRLFVSQGRFAVSVRTDFMTSHNVFPHFFFPFLPVTTSEMFSCASASLVD